MQAPTDSWGPLAVKKNLIRPQSSHLTAQTSHLTSHTSYPASHTSHTSHLTPHSSNFTPYTSRLTPHTSHLTPHAWNHALCTSRLRLPDLPPETSDVTPHITHLTPGVSHLEGRAQDTNSPCFVATHVDCWARTTDRQITYLTRYVPTHKYSPRHLNSCCFFWLVENSRDAQLLVERS